MSKSQTSDEVQRLRQEVAELRVELEAARPILTRVVEICSLDVIRKSLGERTASEQIRQASIEQERQRAEKRAAKAQAEQAARNERLEAAATILRETAWIRVSAPQGWSSTMPIPSGTRSYISIESWGSREMSREELRSLMASDQQNEIREGLASGQLQFDPLPDNFDSLDTGAQRRLENQWRARRGGK